MVKAFSSSFYAALTLLVVLISGCSTVKYEEVSSKGRLQGKLFVMWVGEGHPYLGDGKFVLAQPPSDPLRFTRFDAQGKQVGETLIPEIMYTDGGSIPRVATLLEGLSPWGYAPAYMIHDWIFVAKNCVEDGEASAAEQVVKDMDFDDSVRVLVEVIKVLIEKGTVKERDIVKEGIMRAVSSPISRAKWTAQGECASRRVSPEHIEDVKEAFARSTDKKGNTELRPFLVQGPKNPISERVPEQPLRRIIALYDFN